MYRITTIPTLADNLTYLVDDGKVAVVIDPGEASPVLRRLDEMALSLAAVLITHGHFDHRGGSDELQRRTGCEVVADAFGAIQEASERGFSFEIGPLVFHMLWTPGHSDDSGSYYLPPTQGFPGAVFTGDTLFVGGCGRIFTSSSATMWSSLQLLAALPAETLVYCGHDYSLENYEFAVTVEPHNGEVKARLEQIRSLVESGEPTVPSTIGQELATNPFLRASSTAMKRALGLPAATDVEAFTVLRRIKDRF